MKKLLQLGSQLKAAQDAQLEYLKTKFIAGSTISFFIMSGQVNYSTGVVVGYEHGVRGGSVNVRHDQAKSRSRYLIRTVDVHSIKVV